MLTELPKSVKEKFSPDCSDDGVPTKCNYVQKYLSHWYQCLGEKVATTPTPFITYPILLSAILATGFQALNMKVDYHYYVTLSEGDAINDRNQIESLFPFNMSSNFDPGKRTREGRFGSLIVTPRDGGSVLRKLIFDEVEKLDRKIQQISVEWDGQQWTYKDICAKYNKECFKNSILLLGKNMEQFERGSYPLKYPIHRRRSHLISLLALGGVIRNESNYVISASSVLLNYFLDTGSESREIRSKKWEEEFMELLKYTYFKAITVEISTSASFDKDIADGPILAIPYIPSSVFLVLSFTILTCSTCGWVKSKPWTGIFTVISSGLALVSGVGIVIYAGYPMVSLNMIIPFLIMGIGMDDTFVMLSSWKRTDPKHSVEKRLAETYSEAGIAITITSLTNFVSFLLGWAFGSITSIKVFCVYMASSIAFDYLYQVTFVGACLALCGYAEKRGLHCLTFIPVKKEPYAGRLKLFYKLFCAPPSTEDNEMSRLYSLAIFDEFWNFVGTAMTRRITKLFVVLMYIIYLIAAIWAATKVTETDGYEGITIYNSSANRYLKATFANYYQDRERIQFVINTTLNYADPGIQSEIEEIVQRFESHPFLSDSSLTEFWLRSYLEFLQHSSISGYNTTDPHDFILILKRLFLKHPLALKFKDDIIFSSDGTSIIASRFFCQTNITRSYKDFRVEATKFKEVVHNAPFPILFYHSLFPSFEALNSMVPSTLQTLAMVAGTVAVISWIFLPGVSSTLCITYSIGSIGVGVVGYMTLWDVSLSSISLTTLIIVLGMSVDYGAHISCAYICRDTKDRNERLREAITLVAMPIFQGCVTTVLSVAVFVFIPSVALKIVVKMIILVCFIAAIHGIVFLPVLLYFTEYLIDIIRLKLYWRNKTFVLEQNSGTKNNASASQVEHSRNISIISVNS